MFLRKILRRSFSRDPQTNKVDILGVDDEFHKLSEQDGSPESYELKGIPSQHCGCLAPAAGRCRECGALSCARCHRHCGGTDNPHPSGCGAPLCRQHAHHLQMADGQAAVPFCKDCYGKLVRKSCWITTRKILLLPFVEEDRDKNAR